MPTAFKEAQSGGAAAGDQPTSSTSKEAAGSSESTKPKGQTSKPKDANDDKEEADWPSVQLLQHQAAVAVAYFHNEIALRQGRDAIAIAKLNWHHQGVRPLSEEVVKDLEKRLDDNDAWYKKHADTAKRLNTAEEFEEIMQEVIDDKIVEAEQALAHAGGQAAENPDQTLVEAKEAKAAAVASGSGSGSAAAHLDGATVMEDEEAEEAEDDDDFWAGGSDQLVYGPDGQPVRQG